MSSSSSFKYLAGGIALLAIALGAGFSVLRQGDAAAEADVLSEETELAVPVEAVAAIRGSVAKTLSTSSTIEAEQSASVLAKIGGVVTEVLVGEGERVTAGDVLARLDSEEKRLALEKAQLTLKKTQAELNRAQLSHEQQLISNFDYEKAIFERDLAAAELEVAELELRYTEVTAPFAGRITSRDVVAGKTIQPSDALFSLADFRTLVVKLFLPERDVFELSEGQPVRLLPEALVESAPLSEISFAGRVRDISPVVDPKTGTVKVTVEVVDRTAAVRPGAFVRAQIETDRRDEAVLVPKLSVIREGADDFVFVASGERAERRTVVLGYSREGAVEIVEGLAPDERVIVAGQTTLEDGALIDVIESPR